MNLAKPRIDIGFATNNAPAALAFWQNEIGLPFDYTQPIRRGYKQHRHDLCGSILRSIRSMNRCRTIRHRAIGSY